MNYDEDDKYLEIILGEIVSGHFDKNSNNFYK